MYSLHFTGRGTNNKKIKRLAQHGILSVYMNDLSFNDIEAGFVLVGRTRRVVIALGGLIIGMTSDTLRTQIDRNLEQVISQINVSYDSLFEKIFSSLKYIASRKHVKNSYNNPLDEVEMMSEFAEYVDQYTDVLV